MILILIFTFIVISLCYIFYMNITVNKYIVGKVIYSGLANRINCISSALLISILSGRKLLSIFYIYLCSISF